MIKSILKALSILAIAITSLSAHSNNDNKEFVLTIKNHVFSPAEIKVPANKKVKITVDNQDATPEEFHSDSLKREKIISGKSKLSFFIGPLKAGKYSYMGEFHSNTASGNIIAE